MICSRRLYKGNSYEICLPLKYSGVTGVNIYTDGAVKIPVTPEISGDTLCFEITSEDLDVLADGVLRYELITDSEVSDSNSRFVVKTPEGYSAQTLDILLEEAYQSGYTAGFTDGYDSKICKDEYSGLPLTFEIISGGTINWRIGEPSVRTIEYSKDMGATWSSITSTEEGVRIPVEAGDRVQFRGNNSYYGPYSQGGRFGGSTAIFNVYGNIMSLISAEDFESLSGLTESYSFLGLFGGATGLVSAKNLILPAMVLSFNCYGMMFYGCTSLIETPELPATTLANRCYESMFERCTSLTTAPALPATTLAEYCYRDMFASCTSLTTAPVLSATTLAESCYSSMFYKCTSLTTAPELPATTLAAGCYKGMFQSCYSLTEAPELPATTLVTSGYTNMFQLCSGLTSAPELPATTLAGFCYEGMFSGCTSLTEAPVLPVTNLSGANSCYRWMFAGCTSLTEAPELPATVLDVSCYTGMFADCTGLTASPILPAPAIANSSYNGMFRGCTNLSTITCLLTAGTPIYNWVKNVAATGTFYKNPSATNWTTGVNGIPSGWTVVDYTP